MINNFVLFLALVAAEGAFAASHLNRVNPPFKRRPKLIVALVIDQFRADYLTRFQGRFLAAKLPKGKVGGFSYLQSKGAWVPYGQYQVLQNMTGPGHATVLTGSYPYQSGVPLNNWFDENGNAVYCAEDSAHKTVGAELKDEHPGTSPKNLLSTTLGDELKNAGFNSKVIAIALKDRASIFMGGYRSDLSLWFDSNSFRWVSSSFYLKNGQLPAWVEAQNQWIAGKKDGKLSWEVAGKASGLSTDTAGIEFPKHIVENLGTSFPHKTQVGKKAALSGPFGVEITLDLVEKAIDQYKLGNNAATDILAISLSSHDYLGHDFGPNSLEMEEMTVAEDRAISRLLNFLKGKVKGGLDEVVVVLTADHGIPSSPEYLQAYRVPTGRIDEEKLLQALNAELRESLGEPQEGEYFSGSFENNFYLNRKGLKEGVKEEVVLKAARNWLMAHSDGNYLDVFTRSEWNSKQFPAGIVGKQIGLTYFPGRSGDLVGLVKPYVINGDVGTSHQSGHAYDRTVPLIFTGRMFKPGVYAGEASVVDIAPTLAFILGVVPPSQSEGRILSEIFK